MQLRGDKLFANMLLNLNKKYVFAALGILVLSVTIPLSCLTSGREKEVVFKYDKYLKKPPDIRVMLLKNVKKVEIEIDSSYNISDINNNIVFAQGNNLPKSSIRLNSDEFHIGPVSSRFISEVPNSLLKANDGVKITSQNSDFIKLNNSKFQGKLLIIPQKEDRFSVLEEINIEDYLLGVIESEMPAKWQDDAILAQAIAARSYAIYKKKIGKYSKYHIGKLDLAYNGSYKILAKTRGIVDKSRGIVMVYNWKLFPGYFHSTCGGHTEDINLIFGLKSILPLSGVRCGYCENSKYYRWKKNIKKNEIERKLKDSKIKIKHVKGIVRERIGNGDHCSTIKVTHSGGIKKLDANEFRLMLGPNYLRSTAFNVKNNGDSLIFEGKGWGHGVGLCQYGAQNMARSGFKWFEILKYYYPGIELVKIY